MINKSFFKKINIAILFFIVSTALFAEKHNKTQNLPTLWDFGAKKCIPCKMMAPILEKMETEYKGKLIVRFTDVWMHENIQLAKEHGIQSIPTQIFFDENGRELRRHVGYASEEDILAEWKSLGFDFSKDKANISEVSTHDSNK